MTVWNSETPARPDKVETGEAWLPHFKGKLNFINFFLWGASLLCGNHWGSRKGQITRSKKKEREMMWSWRCSDFQSGPMLVWNRLCPQHGQLQADGLEKKIIGEGKTKKWFGPHLIWVKGLKLKLPLSPLTQTITSFPEHHCWTDEPAAGWLGVNTLKNVQP